MPGGKDPGPSIKKKSTYEAVKKKLGNPESEATKAKAAKIANAQYDKEHGVKSSAKKGKGK